MSAASLTDKLLFLRKLPVLVHATSDEPSPCPGYLYEAVADMSRESAGTCHCLLEFLLERLRGGSCHSKLKVLKLCRHLLDHGSPQFTLALRRNAACLQQFSVYAGPPDALYGNAHYRNVRTAAADLAGALYADDPDSPPKPRDRPPPSTGMGCVSDGRTPPRASMQGFGFTAPGAGEGLLDRIQRAASVVLATATPTPSQQPIRNTGSGLHRDGYQPMAAEEVSLTTGAARPAERAARDTRIAVHRPGQAGGGWDESDSSDSLSQASVGAGVRLSGPASLSGSHRSGSDGHSLEPDVTATLPPGRQEGAGGDEEDEEEEEEEREEQQLVARVVGGSRPFLSPAENQALLRECVRTPNGTGCAVAGLLNCELLAVRLSERLGDPSDTVKMRAMAALSSLVNSDLLSHEQVWGAAASALHTVSGGPPGACADRANKILRQLQSLGSSGGSSRGSPSPLHTPPPGPAAPASPAIPAAPPGPAEERPRPGRGPQAQGAPSLFAGMEIRVVGPGIAEGPEQEGLRPKRRGSGAGSTSRARTRPSGPPAERTPGAEASVRPGEGGPPSSRGGEGGQVAGPYCPPTLATSSSAFSFLSS
ncbi:AP-4 complex accessory subunit tepsin isoform X1 [Petromyzon marinus]|uniref:AP-4 complex accessory subunit tepsin isoform X1 n=1 Tax=Petromyzon marinus TaxID=7757 RepID=UPI003F7065C5